MLSLQDYTHRMFMTSYKGKYQCIEKSYGDDDDEQEDAKATGSSKEEEEEKRKDTEGAWREKAARGTRK